MEDQTCLYSRRKDRKTNTEKQASMKHIKVEQGSGGGRSGGGSLTKKVARLGSISMYDSEANRADKRGPNVRVSLMRKLTDKAPSTRRAGHGGRKVL